MARHDRTPSGERGFNLIIGVTDTGSHRGTSGINLAAQELIVFPRFALTLDKLAHQLAQDLRCWPVGSLRFGHELGA
jgi:hypothetical protein